MVYQINFTFCITEITMLPVFPSLPMPEKCQLELGLLQANKQVILFKKKGNALKWRL